MRHAEGISRLPCTGQKRNECLPGLLESLRNEFLFHSSLPGNHARLVCSAHLLHRAPSVLTACPPVGPASGPDFQKVTGQRCPMARNTSGRYSRGSWASNHLRWKPENLAVGVGSPSEILAWALAAPVGRKENDTQRSHTRSSNQSSPSKVTGGARAVRPFQRSFSEQTLPCDPHPVTCQCAAGSKRKRPSWMLMDAQVTSL